MKAAASTVALAMILLGASPFAAASAPAPERPVGGCLSPPGPVIEEDEGEAIWENFTWGEEENDQLTADKAAPFEAPREAEP